MRALPLTVLLVAWCLACDEGGTSGSSPATANGDASAPIDGGDGGDGGGGDGDDGGAGDGSMDDPGPTMGLQSVTVDPTEIEVTTDGTGDAEQATITVTGMFADGSSRDVTSDVSWSVDDERLGTVEDGVFVSSGIGGTTVIRVNANGVDEVTIEVTVVVDATIEVGSEVPAGADGMFPADTSGDDTTSAEGPRVIYPSHETMFPRNVQRILHQWTHTGLDLFELRFDSELAHIRLLTTDAEYTPDAATWQTLAETHAGRSLTFSVRGTKQADPSTVYRSQDVTLYYSEDDVSGALFYWSTGAEGVMRATIDAPLATKFYSDPAGDSADSCVSCHTVSRNGQRLVAGFDGESLHSIGVEGRTVEIDSGDDFGWGTFDPPADKLLYASEGVLRLLDAETGDVLNEEVDLGDWDATHPDWAPSGDFVALTVNQDGMKNKDVQGASIARVAVDAQGNFGSVEVLVAPNAIEGADNLFFPAVSPDSRWIAFAAGEGKSKDNTTAELYVVAAAGGTPQLLTRLDRRARDDRGPHDTNLEMGNSMPTWAPMNAQGTYWLAFSSLRAYADVRPPDDKEDQLWAAALDPAKLGTAEDASFAAFWMPFQQIDEGNHRVFWVVNTEEECPSETELCDDDLDNDCDGEVDEVGCCAPEAEVCGDNMDNDCDGAIDEGCIDECAPPMMCECDSVERAEVCEDGIDNDCDGDVDGADSDCVIIQ